ncbi:MAG: hypothetical protein WC839_01540 [Candidatus Paceibacterota bacterium]
MCNCTGDNLLVFGAGVVEEEFPKSAESVKRIQNHLDKGSIYSAGLALADCSEKLSPEAFVSMRKEINICSRSKKVEGKIFSPTSSGKGKAGAHGNPFGNGHS